MNPTGDGQNGSGKSRLDRLEGLMELLIDDHLKFSNEHNKLLTAQVLLTDAQARTDKTVRELAERMNDLTERLNALIHVVDGMIRKPPAN